MTFSLTLTYCKQQSVATADVIVSNTEEKYKNKEYKELSVMLLLSLVCSYSLKFSLSAKFLKIHTYTKIVD